MQSGIIDHPFGAGGKGYNLQMVWEETEINVQANTSTVKVTANLIADKGYGITSTKTKTIKITCDGVTQSGTCKVAVSGGSTKQLFSAIFNVTHDADGSKTAALVCRLNIDITISGNHVSYVQSSGDAVLTSISANPDAPASCTITAGFGNYVGLGDTITMTWAAAAGTVTGYEVQLSHGSSGWQAFRTVEGASTTGTLTATDIQLTGAGKAVKIRVRTLNGTLASDWVESNTLIITGGMKLKTGGAWKQGSTWIKVNGTWRRVKRVWVKVNGTWQYTK